MKINIDELTHIYTGKYEQQIFQNVSISTREADKIALVGPSGVGKTTLINLLGGIIKPTFGKIFYDDTEIVSLNIDERTEFRRDNIGFVFQDFRLIPHLSVEENIKITLYLNKIAKSKHDDMVSNILDSVDLSNYAKVKPSILSGGQQQRVAIASALVNNPHVVLADEPTGNLDQDTAAMIIDLLIKLSDENKSTLIICAHDQMVINKMQRRWNITNLNIEEN